MSAPDRERDDAEALRHTRDRIDRLLGELRASSSALAWSGIEEVLSAVTEMYGRGLARMLEIFVERGGAATHAALGDDPMVGSLLLLHGLHPVPLAARVERAVYRVRRALGAERGTIAHWLDPDGRLTLRVTGDWTASGLSRQRADTLARRIVEDGAPDVLDLFIDTDAATFAHEERLESMLTEPAREAAP
jgi:hypothetical protein